MASVDHNPDRHPEIDRTLPEGWASAGLGVIADSLTYGYTASATASSHGPRFLRITDIQNGRVDWNSVPTCTIEEMDIRKYGLVPGDIVFARTGATTGKSFLIRSCPLAVFASYLIRLRLLPEINPALLDYFFQTPDYWTFISDNVAGIAQPNCNATKLSELQIPIPPSGEQQRLVEAIAALLSKVGAARDHLFRVPPILKRFRQAVLTAACSGKLTENWREKHIEVEPATKTLERIKQVRSNGKQVTNETPVDFDDLPELPESWVWAKFGVLLGELRNGISTKPELSPPGVSILRISSVRAGSVSLSEHRFLPHGADLLRVYGLRDGDLLFTRYNGSLDLLGVCGMVRGLGSASILYPDKLMRVRFDHDYVLPAYAELFFQSAGARDRLTAQSRSSAGQQGVSGADIKSQPFALPPPAEQAEIIDRVSPLLALADTIEDRFVKALMHSDKLTQSILAKAFRGELVPTEAELARREGRDYEPASVLLERIRKDCQKGPEASKRNGKKATANRRASDENRSTKS